MIWSKISEEVLQWVALKIRQGWKPWAEGGIPFPLTAFVEQEVRAPQFPSIRMHTGLELSSAKDYCADLPPDEGTAEKLTWPNCYPNRYY